jgi:hypothetical protein
MRGDPPSGITYNIKVYNWETRKYDCFYDVTYIYINQISIQIYFNGWSEDAIYKYANTNREGEVNE